MNSDPRCMHTYTHKGVGKFYAREDLIWLSEHVVVIPYLIRVTYVLTDILQYRRDHQGHNNKY